MGFTFEDRHLIKCLRVSKGYGATRLCKTFLHRQWNVGGMKTLIEKIEMTGSTSIDRQLQQGVVVHAVCPYACQHQRS